MDRDRLPRDRSARLAGRGDPPRRAKLGGVRGDIRTAAEVLTPEREAEWAMRRGQRDDPLLRGIWREFVASGGPIGLDALASRVPYLSPTEFRARLGVLDAADLIELDDGRVYLAYPFTARP